MTPGTRISLAVWSALVIAFLWIPLVIIALYAFNESRIQAWPIEGFTLQWFERAIDNPGARDALFLSLKAAVGATLLAAVGGAAPARANETAPRDLRARADSLYRVMRDALARADWSTFGRAFDALGAALRAPAP